MAAKAKAPVKAAKSKVAPKATVTTAKAKGLQLTVAQWAAYNKAYSAAAANARRSIALAASSRAYRKYRLNAAYATIKKYQAARGAAQAAAVAAYATRQSWRQSRLAHQNSALQARIELDMFNHATLAGRLQYAQGGERGYMNAAVLRTVDSKQATAYETKVFAQIAKTAKKASKSTLPKTKITANSAVVKAAAAAAGLAAAEQVPGKGPTGSSSASAKAKATAKNTVAKTRAARKAGHKAASASKKAPVKAAKSRTAPLTPGNDPAMYASAMYGFCPPAPPRKPAVVTGMWAGDEVTPNCIVTAVANHLRHVRNFTATEAEIQALAEECGGEPTIEGVLWSIFQSGWPWRCHLFDYNEVDPAEAEGKAGLVIGYEVTRDDGSKGDHAALAFAKGSVVSWGQVTDREALVEEAWDLIWVS